MAEQRARDTGNPWLPPVMALLLASVTVVVACATVPRQFIAPGVDLTGRPRVAFIPLENLAEIPESGAVVMNVFFAELVRVGIFDLVEMGEVEAALRELRIRKTGSLPTEQVRQIAEQLGVNYLMIGSILEAGTVSTPDGVIPSLGVALRLLDGTDARVVWANVHIRTGEDKEGMFGWGRENDFEQLVLETATETFEQLRKTIAASASHARNTK
jgi:TolB-like protein